MSERPVVAAVVLRLPPPISVNALHRAFSRGGRVSSIKSKRYRDWLVLAGTMIQLQNPGRIEGGYGITIKVPKKCRIDLDNVAKAVNDVAQAHGIISNDRLCTRLLVERGVEDETVVFFISSKEEQ